MGLGIPPEWGGSGGDSRSVAAVLEEVSRASAAVATLLSVQLSVVEAPLLQWGTDAQRAEFLRPLAEGRLLGAFALTEPGAGSDAAAIRTHYARENGGFRLTGSKTFITNAASADVVLLFARGEVPPERISAFLLPKGTPGFRPGNPFDKLGLKGSETVELTLDGVRLPVENLLGPEGAGLRVALGALTGGRVGIAACALGVAQAGYDRLRVACELDPTDANRIRLARSYVDVLSARALVEGAAERKDRGEPFVEEASAAKLAASRAALEVTARAVDAEAETGGSRASEAMRLWRDARVFPIVEGTSEIQELLLGRTLAGKTARSGSATDSP